MKKLIYAAAVCAAMLSSCKKDNTVTNNTNTQTTTPQQSNSMTLDGSGYASTQIVWDETIKGNSEGMDINRGLYDPTCVNPHTTIMKDKQDDKKDYSLLIAIYDTPKVGTYNFKQLEKAGINIICTDKVTKTTKDYTSVDDQGTLTVTQADAPGGLIKLKFSGKFVSKEDGSQITVNATELQVTRNPDEK